MQLSDEQKAIIEYDGNAVINACAGSGKSTTLVEYAKRYPHKNFLYLVFNRSAKDEAIRKFLAAGVSNVTIETAHSLAYRGLDVRNRFTLTKSGNLKTYDIMKLCGIRSTTAVDAVQGLVLSKHIQKMLNSYCNSNVQKLGDIDYPATITDEKAALFVQRHLDTISGCCRDILTKMYKSEIPITHDAYLKFYQLTNPELPYSHILYDEAQDCSPVMLDIFTRQKATKTAVGDQHQAIYGFRDAVNSLAQLDYKKFNLTTSFRFPQEIADLSMRALRLKKKFGMLKDIHQIKGLGTSSKCDSHAVLARTNLRLLDRAIEEVVVRGTNRIHFEGDLNSYTYAAEGGSLYDILYLRLGHAHKVQNEFIRNFRSFHALQEYISATEDNELGLMVEIVNKYGNSLWDCMRRLKECHVPKEMAQLVFSTVHKAKGAEYDQVEILEGFITGDKIDGILAAQYRSAKTGEENPKKADYAALAEEVNILYVCLTRTRNVLFMGFDLEQGSTGGEARVFGKRPPEGDILNNKLVEGAIF